MSIESESSDLQEPITDPRFWRKIRTDFRQLSAVLSRLKRRLDAVWSNISWDENGNEFWYLDGGMTMPKHDVYQFESLAERAAIGRGYRGSSARDFWLEQLKAAGLSVKAPTHTLFCDEGPVEREYVIIENVCQASADCCERLINEAMKVWLASGPRHGKARNQTESPAAELAANEQTVNRALPASAKPGSPTEPAPTTALRGLGEPTPDDWYWYHKFKAARVLLLNGYLGKAKANIEKLTDYLDDMSIRIPDNVSWSERNWERCRAEHLKLIAEWGYRKSRRCQAWQNEHPNEKPPKGERGT